MWMRNHRINNAVVYFLMIKPGNAYLFNFATQRWKNHCYLFNQAMIKLWFKTDWAWNALQKENRDTHSRIVRNQRLKWSNHIACYIWRNLFLNYWNTGIVYGVFPVCGMPKWLIQLSITLISKKYRSNEA